MVIVNAKNLGKGLLFEIRFQGKEYILTINETGKNWSEMLEQSGSSKTFTEIKDTKKINQLEKGFRDVMFIPIN